MRQEPHKRLKSLVRAGRLELPRPLGQQILSLPRLPFRHARRSASRLYLRQTTGQPALRRALKAIQAGPASDA